MIFVVPDWQCEGARLPGSLLLPSLSGLCGTLPEWWLTPLTGVCRQRVQELSLDERRQAVHYVLEYLGGMLLHIIRLTKTPGKREKCSNDKHLPLFINKEKREYWNLKYFFSCPYTWDTIQAVDFDRCIYLSMWGCEHSLFSTSRAPALCHIGFSESKNLTSKERNISHSVT